MVNYCMNFLLNKKNLQNFFGLIFSIPFFSSSQIFVKTKLQCRVKKGSNIIKAQTKKRGVNVPIHWLLTAQIVSVCVFISLSVNVQ